MSRSVIAVAGAGVLLALSLSWHLAGQAALGAADRVRLAALLLGPYVGMFVALGFAGAFVLRRAARFVPPRRTTLGVVSGALILYVGLSGLEGRRLASSRAHARLAFQAIAPEPLGARLLLVGIDGLDWAYVEALRARGEMPVLDSLARSGRIAPLETLVPTESPAIWTTIASGRDPSVHGVLGFFDWVLPGLSRPINVRPIRRMGLSRLFRLGERIGVARRSLPGAESCRVARIWDVVSARGGRSIVVGWWATTPAPEISGVIVSDVFYRAPDGEMLVVHPPDRSVALEAYRVRSADIPVSDVTALVGPADGSTQDHVRHLLSLDRTHVALARALLASDPDAALVAVYLRGLDMLSHLMLGEGTPLRPLQTMGTAAGAVSAYHRALDRILGELVRLAPGSIVCVVSDHGFREERPGTFGHRDAPPGVLVLSGAFEPLDAFPAHVREVAAGLGRLLGLPPIERWGVPPASATGGMPRLDAEARARLRALGYLR